MEFQLVGKKSVENSLIRPEIENYLELELGCKQENNQYTFIIF